MGISGGNNALKKGALCTESKISTAQTLQLVLDHNMDPGHLNRTLD